jgi:hypothetical protein
MNVPHSDGRAYNLPRPELPAGITCASAVTSADPDGSAIRICTSRAVEEIRRDATALGITRESDLDAIGEAATRGHLFGWSVATRQATALIHVLRDRGQHPDLPAGIRRFPAAVAAAMLNTETDPRNVAACIAQSAAGTHPRIDAALALMVATYEAATVARDLADPEAVRAYAARVARFDRQDYEQPVALAYRRPDFDRRDERLSKGRDVAAKALRAWAATVGLKDGAALDAIELAASVAYSAGFSGSRIVPPMNHYEWLYSEMRPEPLQRAATIALLAYREPKLSALDREIVAGDFIHTAIVHDLPTPENVMGASLAIRAAVHAVIAVQDAAPVTTEPGAPVTESDTAPRKHGKGRA